MLCCPPRAKNQEVRSGGLESVGQFQPKNAWKLHFKTYKHYCYKEKKRKCFHESSSICWYKYDLKLQTFDLNTKYFHTSEFSDNPLSFISESETILGRTLWYTWRGPLQTSRSLWVYSQVKCTEGHDLRLSHTRSWKTKDRLKIRRYGNILCWGQKFEALNKKKAV